MKLLFVSCLGLSVAGTTVLFVVAVPMLITLFIVMVINVLQTKKPGWLPNILKNWEFLPLWMRSLDPMDQVNKLSNHTGPITT